MIQLLDLPDPLENPRFTVDGSIELEEEIAAICDLVLLRVQNIVGEKRLVALVLAGGYGRGEGVVLVENDGMEKPYNDVEFYAFLSGVHGLNAWRFQSALNEMGEELSHSLGIDVEVRGMSFGSLRRSRASMFHHDLVKGHKCIVGDESMFAGCEHHLDPSQIPICEATRLLMNRCMGLLLARLRLEREAFSQDDADFVLRNIYKARLALGDAVLTKFHQYHWSCRERATRLTRFAEFEIPAFELIQDYHQEGVRFKLHPHHAHSDQHGLWCLWLETTHVARQLWLWMEEIRLQERFGSMENYLESSLDKWPEGKGCSNIFRNVRDVMAGGLKGFGGLRHPRGRVIHQMACHLWLEKGSTDFFCGASPTLPSLPELEVEEIEKLMDSWRRCA